MLPLITAALEASYQPRLGEVLSGIFGSVSLTAWICLLLPQLITNYKTKSADALSMKFLLIWLSGDVCNLSGALFTNLAPSTIALASYFCFADIILISQCTYYNTINARRRAAAAARRERHHHRHSRLSTDEWAGTSALPSTVADNHAVPPTVTETDPLLPPPSSTAAAAAADGTTGGTPHQHHNHHRHHHHHDKSLSKRRHSSSSSIGDPLSRILTGDEDSEEEEAGAGGASRAWLSNAISLIAVWVVGVAGWYFSYRMGAWGPEDGAGDVAAPGDDGEAVAKEPVAVVGMVLGYASALCYLCARIPQIIKNYREKSCEGLALLFFMLSLTGNFTYGASVISYSQERDYVVRALPWLLGSLGTMVEDSIIFVQFRLYSPKRQLKAGGAA
ncbi:hypothetical protein VTH82DRAFT_7476 [Thermothelomyces myriococcoides]